MSRNQISPTLNHEQVQSVADEPAPVQHAFLRTLYSHFFLSTTAISLATIALCRSDARSVLAAQPLLLAPFALVWLAALTGWARTRAGIRSDRSRAIFVVNGALNVVAHAAEAVTCGGLLAVGLEAVDRQVLANLPSAIDVYPIIVRAFFAMWSSVLGALVVVLSSSPASIGTSVQSIRRGAILGGVTAALSNAMLDPRLDWFEPALTVVAIGVMHAHLLRHLPTLMERLRAEDAPLAAHVLGSRCGLAVIRALGGREDEVVRAWEEVEVKEKQEV